MNALLLSFVPLLLGLTLLFIVKPQLRIVQAGFLLLGALTLAFTSLGYGVSTVGQVLLALVVAEAIHLIIVGVSGTRFHPTSHGSLLYSIGLLPWAVGWEASLLYWALTALLLTVATALKGGFTIKSLKVREVKATTLPPRRTLVFMVAALLAIVLFLYLTQA